MYAVGLGLKQNYARAYLLLDLACAANDPESCADLGNLYAQGHGVRQDAARALTTLIKACDLGSKLGCARLDDFAPDRERRDGVIR